PALRAQRRLGVPGGDFRAPLARPGPGHDPERARAHLLSDMGRAGSRDHRLTHPGEGRTTATGNRPAGAAERRSGCRPGGAVPEGGTEERVDMIGVKGVLFPLLAGLCWAAFFYKVHDLRVRQHDPALVALLAAFAVRGTAFLLATPRVAASLDQLTGM